MAAVHGLIKVLTREEMQRLHDAARQILDRAGMLVDHAEALEYLRQAGCRVDFDRKHVSFPPEITQNAIDKMRRDFTLADRQGVEMPVRFSEVHFSTSPVRIRQAFTSNAGGFVPYILDLDGTRRFATSQDVRDAIRLVDGLEHIDMMGLPVVASDVPEKDRPVAMAAELVKGTRKIGGIEAWDAADVRALHRMASVVCGSPEAARKRPLLAGYGEVRSPLCLDYNMAEVFIESVKLGLPQTVDTMPNAGATAPASGGGALAQGLAESMSAVVLGYAIDPNAMLGLDITPSYCDMRGGSFPYSGADRLPLVAAANQMLNEFYGRPGGCHGGKTDASSVGAQAGAEKALSILFPILCGASGIGTVGQLGSTTFSPIQVVIDNEIIGYVKRMLAAFEIDDLAWAVEAICEVGPGGHFLGHQSTAERFRAEFWLDHIFERLAFQSGDLQSHDVLVERARAKAQRILAEHQPEPLPKDKVAAIDEIVKESAAARR
jgi:trimethylamine--corrinoid protein Co-methyltransferase